MNAASTRKRHLAGAVLIGGLTIFSLTLLRSELTYDEAVYLRLARTIAESGLPLRRTFEDFETFRLFTNSPPLVLYVASLSQLITPGDERLTRLVHLAVFALPTYVLVWWVGLQRFGTHAGVLGLLALAGSGSYLQATSRLLLDVPLGLLALVALLGFDCGSREGPWRTWWCWFTALTVALAVWTKYQAVCACAAMALYAGWQVAIRG